MSDTMDDIQFTDRYEALGIKPPRRLYCRGYCEATGIVPVYMPEGDKRAGENLARSGPEDDVELVLAWREAEAVEPTDDGWHFVKCPQCGGDGKAHGFDKITAFLHSLERDWSFAKGHLFVKPYSNTTAQTVLAHQRLALEENPLAFSIEIDPATGKEIARPWEGKVGYGDRLDVPNPWWWNRRLALKVLFRR